MNNHIKKAYETGHLVLFLGAGASLSSKDQFGKHLLSASQLSKEIAENAGFEYTGESLSTVYSAAKEVMGNGLYDLLIGLYKHCTPSDEYNQLARYVWPRIYTINIDDALDKALITNSTQQLNVRHRYDKIVDQDQVLRNLDYIKLNGSIDRVESGFVFSPDEYGYAASKPPLWYRELAEDFYRYMFIFIGTKLNEPLFYHQIARYKSETRSSERRGYVLTPSVSAIEQNSLKTINLEHISGSLSDFTSWLQSAFPAPLAPIDIAYNRNPALRKLLAKETIEEQTLYASLFDDVFHVNRKHLKSSGIASKNNKKVRSYYKGFKPDWVDIFEGIPAIITDTTKLYGKVKSLLAAVGNLIVVYGPAGCGKTTLLKQVALLITEEDNIPCYFLERPTSNFRELIVELERLHTSRFCLFYDRLDAHALAIKDIFESGIFKNCLLVGSESQRKWKGEVKDIIGKYSSCDLHISLINENDAEAILTKLEKYGPWTRLGKMPKNEQIKELVEHSKRQLLIGLLEVTYGHGFEKIIEREYTEIKDDSERTFVILVGLATIHRYYIKHEYVSRALTSLGISNSVSYFVRKLEGIIGFYNGVLIARHPVYVRHLFSEVISSAEIFPALKALLSSYTVYESPVYRNVAKNELQIFKALINHKFLKDIFRQDRQLIARIYESFEKEFENDGHFLLQFGLALRDFNNQAGAYEKIKTASFAFPSSLHIEHALAQQELILACFEPSKVRAYSLLHDAIERLENLNRFFQARNAYPIVTLSEGHTSVVRRFEDDDIAKEVARVYANRIASISGYSQHSRLRAAWTRLTQYATTGIWEEPRDVQYDYLTTD
jgi:energy-coupling factor transporter ATP-binding protein EcfA2